MASTTDSLTLGDTVYIVDEGDYMTYGFAGPDAEARIERWSMFGEETFDWCAPGLVVAA